MPEDPSLSTIAVQVAMLAERLSGHVDREERGLWPRIEAMFDDVRQQRSDDMGRLLEVIGDLKEHVTELNGRFYGGIVALITTLIGIIGALGAKMLGLV